MPRTITIDGVQTVQIQLARDENGQLHIMAEYHLKSGSQVIQVEYQNITDRLSAARRAAMRAAFDAIDQDISAAELP